MKPKIHLITYSISILMTVVGSSSCAEQNHFPPARKKQAKYLKEQKEEYDNPTESYIEEKEDIATKYDIHK